MLRTTHKITAALGNHKFTLLSLCFFIVAAIAFTWPYAIHPFSTYMSPPYGDVPNSVTKFDAIKREHLNPFVDGRIKMIAVPDGIRSNVGVDRVSFFSTLFLWIGTLLTTSLFTHGFFVFFGYVSSSFVMYLFIYRYTRDRKAALFAGALSICFPLFLSLARAAPIYMYTWLYILPMWAYLELARGFTKRRLLIAILSFVPGFFWTPYFMYHIGLITLSCTTLYCVQVYRRTRHIALRVLLPSLGMLIVAAGVYVLAGRASQYAVIPDRSMQDVYEESVHPLMLVTPGSFSWFGHAAYEWMSAHVNRLKGTNLYLGVSVIILAFYAIVRTFKNRSSSGESYLVATLSVVGAVAFIFSLAPTIHILWFNIPTPNDIVAHLVPALRAGQRLVGVLMVCTAGLASIGLKHLVSYVPKTYSIVVLFAACALVFIDIAAIPPSLTTRFPRDSAIVSLSKQRTGLFAEYLSGSLVGDPSQVACKNYMVLNMPTMNYCGLDIFAPPHTLQTIWRLASHPKPQQPELLRGYGVQYVIIDSTDHSTQKIYNNPRSGYKLILSDSHFSIYSRVAG